MRDDAPIPSILRPARTARRRTPEPMPPQQLVRVDRPLPPLPAQSREPPTNLADQQPQPRAEPPIVHPRAVTLAPVATINTRGAVHEGNGAASASPDDAAAAAALMAILRQDARNTALLALIDPRDLLEVVRATLLTARQRDGAGQQAAGALWRMLQVSWATGSMPLAAKPASTDPPAANRASAAALMSAFQAAVTRAEAGRGRSRVMLSVDTAPDAAADLAVDEGARKMAEQARYSAAPEPPTIDAQWLVRRH